MNVRDLRDRYPEAKCEKSLCDFEVVKDRPEVTIERCKLCGKRLRFNKVDGRIDNSRYARSHIRDFLQPGSVAYDEIYGTSWKKRKQYKKGPTKEEIYEEAMDTAKTLERLESRGVRVDKEI